MTLYKTDHIKENLKFQHKIFFEDFEIKNKRKSILGILSVGENLSSQKYIQLKKKYAQEIGVFILEINLDQNVSVQEIQNSVLELNKKADGIIVQLPLPENFSVLQVESILNKIDSKKDIDILSNNISDCNCEDCGQKNNFLSPVVFAIKNILEEKKVSLQNKVITILGKGKLVGLPVYDFLQDLCIKEKDFETLNSINLLDKKDFEESSENFFEIIKNSDIVISGIGSPLFLKKEMLKKDSVLIDAGTSEWQGSMKGDAEISCKDVTSLFISTPGGVGPLTLVGLFENLKLGVK